VGGDEAEALVEAVGVGAGLVAGQLDQRAAPAASLGDGPADDGAAEALVAEPGRDPDRLDLGPQRAPAGQPGNERELQRRDDVAAGVGDEQQMGRITSMARNARS
jgi:hypothetical protein